MSELSKFIAEHAILVALAFGVLWSGFVALLVSDRKELKEAVPRIEEQLHTFKEENIKAHGDILLQVAAVEAKIPDGKLTEAFEKIDKIVDLLESK